MASSRLRYFAWTLTGAVGAGFARNLAMNGSLFPIDVEPRTGTALPLFDRHFAGVSWQDLPAALRDNGDKVIALVRDVAAIAPPQNGTATVYDGISTVEGHLGVLYNRIEHGEEARERFFDRAFALRGPFGAFPRGSLLLPESLGPGYVAADNKRDFLRANQDQIKAFNADILDKPKSSGWSFKGNYIVLGNGSLVRCAQHEMVVDAGGSAVQVLHLQTSSWHVFDGSYVWAYSYSIERPQFIDSIGLQAGKHPCRTMDMANVSGGVALFHYNNRAAVDVLTARQNGPFRSGDGTVVRDRGLRFLGCCLASLDYLSPVFQEARVVFGPGFTVAEIDNAAATHIVAHGPQSLDTIALPSASDTGVSLDGVHVVLLDSPFGTADGPAGADRVRAVAADLLRYQMNQDTWEDIDRDVTGYAAQKFGADWTSEGRDDLVSSLLDDPAERLQIGKLIKSNTLDVVMPQLQATITEIAPASADAAALTRHVDAWFAFETVDPLLADGGALTASLSLQILNEQVTRIDRTALDASLAAAKNRLAAESAETMRLKAAAQTAQGDELKQIVDELAAHTAAQEEAAEQEAIYEQQARDIDNHDALAKEQGDHIREQSGELFPDGG